MCAQESDEKLQESVLSFHLMSSEGRAQASWLGGQCFPHSLSHLTRVAYVNIELAISLVGLL